MVVENLSISVGLGSTKFVSARSLAAGRRVSRPAGGLAFNRDYIFAKVKYDNIKITNQN